MRRKTFSGSWSFGQEHHTTHLVKVSIHPTKENQEDKKKENSNLAGFYSPQSVNKPKPHKHVNPSLAVKKTITETTITVVYSYLNSDFSHCILGGSCRVYLPELAEWPNKSST